MRTLTINRKRNMLVSIVVKFIVKLDGQPVGKLGNGDTLELPISSRTHTVEFLSNIPAGKSPAPVYIPAGSGSCIANVSTNSKGWRVDLECQPGNPLQERSDALELIAGFVLLSIERNMAAKLQEFRDAGLELHVIHDIGPTCITIIPDERREGGIAGEPIEMTYRELTEDGKVIEALTVEERKCIAGKVQAMATVDSALANLNVECSGARLDVSLK